MAEAPIVMLRECTSQATVNDAQRSNIIAANVVAEIVRSTIGPRGMDKMLVAGIADSVITNDGAGVETSINQLAAMLGVRAAHGPAKAGEQRRSVLDGSKLGVGRIPLSEGLRKTVDWFKAQK